jgi:hypothetical protein
LRVKDACLLLTDRSYKEGGKKVTFELPELKSMESAARPEADEGDNRTRKGGIIVVERPSHQLSWNRETINITQDERQSI